MCLSRVGESIRSEGSTVDVRLCWVLRSVGRRWKLVLSRHRLWLGLIRAAGGIGGIVLRWVLLGMIRVPAGRVEIWEASVCAGGVFYEGVVGQATR